MNLHISVQVYKCTSVQVYKFTSVQVYKCTSVQVYKCTSVQVYKTQGAEWGRDGTLWFSIAAWVVVL